MPTLKLEHVVSAETGLFHIAGLDEAGRGAIAGPVVAAAVILPLNDPDLLKKLRDVNDSKQLTAKARARLYQLIVDNVLAYGIGSAAAEVVDEVGIIPATKQAMSQGIAQLEVPAEYLLIDGRIRLRSIPLPQQAIIRGDSKSLSIAAASILAKVTRDEHMREMDTLYPRYGFAKHKGYGTRQHLEMLSAFGPSPIHRYSFAPLRKTLL